MANLIQKTFDTMTPQTALATASEIERFVNSEISTKIDENAEILSDLAETRVFVDDSLSTYTNLSVIKLSKADYTEKVSDENGELCGNTLYVLDSDTIDAFGQRIENVNDAISTHDAVNLGQMEEFVGNYVKKALSGLKFDNSTPTETVLSAIVTTLGGTWN